MDGSEEAAFDLQLQHKCLRRGAEKEHLRRRPPRQPSDGGCGFGAAGTGCQTAHSCSLNYLPAQERG